MIIPLSRPNCFTALFWLLVVGTLSGCTVGRQPPPMPTSISRSDASGSAVSSAALSTVDVRRSAVEQRMLYQGQVVLARQANLSFGRGGEIAQVYIKDGQHAQAGDIIAELDNTDLQIELQAALLNLEKAQQELEGAEVDLGFERREAELNLRALQLQANELLTETVSGSVLPDSVEARQIQLKIEEAMIQLDRIPETVNPMLAVNLERAELQVQKLRKAILSGQIIAPFDGEVRYISLPAVAEERMVAQAYTAVVRIIEPNNYQIELNLPRAQLEPLREGMPVEVSVASVPGRKLAGVIAALPRPFGTSPSSLAQVALVEPDAMENLYEGITAAVEVTLKSGENALVVPRVALRQDGQTYFVFVQNGDLAERINVAVGLIGTDWAEIVGGLEEGQPVVVSGVR